MPAALLPSEHVVGNAPHLTMPVRLAQEIYQFNRSMAGFPPESWDNYWRMLYFSGTTITTVGFGDIDPLSTRARLTVLLEAVLGIVVAGLFVYSVF